MTTWYCCLPGWTDLWVQLHCPKPGTNSCTFKEFSMWHNSHAATEVPIENLKILAKNISLQPFPRQRQISWTHRIHTESIYSRTQEAAWLLFKYRGLFQFYSTAGQTYALPLFHISFGVVTPKHQLEAILHINGTQVRAEQRNGWGYALSLPCRSKKGQVPTLWKIKWKNAKRKQKF